MRTSALHIACGGHINVSQGTRSVIDGPRHDESPVVRHNCVQLAVRVRHILCGTTNDSHAFRCVLFLSDTETWLLYIYDTEATCTHPHLFIVDIFGHNACVSLCVAKFSRRQNIEH